MRWLLFCLVLCGGCGMRRARTAYPQSNVVLPVLTAESARPFVLEQRLSGSYGERDMDAHVVLQWQDGVLRLVGLAPFGARAFVIEQRGSEVHVESSMNRELPFDPKHVLVDIHRVLFRSAGQPLANGTRERQDGEELVRDAYRNGTLTERRFTSATSPQAKPVVIKFDSKPQPVIAKHVELQNQALGYTLHIETLSQQWLDAAQSAE